MEPQVDKIDQNANRGRGVKNGAGGVCWRSPGVERDVGGGVVVGFSTMTDVKNKYVFK